MRLPRPPQRARRPALEHTVRPGESLATIAGRYGVPGGWQRLYSDNRPVIGSNPNLIRPGLRLRVDATRGF